MASLSHKEVRQFSQAVRQVRSVRSSADFSDHLLRALRSIIPADICVVDWGGRKGIEARTSYDPLGSIPAEVNEAVHRYLHENPLYGQRHHQAVSISDQLTRTKWRRTALYGEAYGKVGQEDGLAIDLDFADGCRLSLNVTRGRRGFSQGERLALTLLRSHVEDMYFALKADERERTEWVSVNAQGMITAHADRARRWFALMDLKQTKHSKRLPDPLHSWFCRCFREGQLGQMPTQGSWDFGKVIVRFVSSEIASDEAFLLFEQRESTLAEPLLSAREYEVLHWLTEGKTNGEISAMLGISPGTVKRHLENLYAKIGVENRHAASLWALRRK